MGRGGELRARQEGARQGQAKADSGERVGAVLILRDSLLIRGVLVCVYEGHSQLYFERASRWLNGK